MKKIVLIIIVFFLISSFQKKELKKLLGIWTCFHKELKDGTTKSEDFDGNEFTLSCDGVSFKLSKGNNGIEYTHNSKFKYKITKDSILNLGNRKYIIEELTDSILVLRDYSADGLGIYVFRNKYRKTQ